jgi:hypothetical protein
MSLKALIDLANRPDTDDAHVRAARAHASYARVRQYGQEIEKRIASKTVSHELLEKVCTL